MALDAAVVGTEYGGPVLETSPGTTTSGNTFVLCVSWGDGRDPPAISDTFGNTYTLQGAIPEGASGDKSAVWVCEGGTGGTGHSVEIEFDENPGGAAAHLIEITGGPSIMDVCPTPVYDTSSPFVLASGPLSSANQVLLSLCASDSGLNPAVHAASGWTNISEMDNLASFWGSVVAKRLVSSADSVTASWTVSGADTARVHVLSFREASAPPPSGGSLLLLGVG